MFIQMDLQSVNTMLYSVVKATPITGLCGLEGSRLSAHEGRHPYAPTAFTPGISRYSFLEAESTLGHTEMSAATE